MSSREKPKSITKHIHQHQHPHEPLLSSPKPHVNSIIIRAEPSSQHAPHAIKCKGFIFAFQGYEHLPNPYWLQTVVRWLSFSDIIHVAILPVTECILSGSIVNDTFYATRVEHITAEQHACTAYIGMGCIEQDANMIRDESYRLFFVPVLQKKLYKEGLKFIKGLIGADYNKSGLLLAGLPRILNQAHFKFPSVLSQETENMFPNKQHPAVFCSQMGLQLCYKCGILKDQNIDPVGCSPKSLLERLQNERVAIEASQNYMIIEEKHRFQ